MKAAVISLCLLLCVALSFGKVYFEDDFSNEDFKSRWVLSSNKQEEGTAGEFVLSAGEYYKDASHKGLKTSQDARFYTISSKFDEDFSTKDSDLVVSYSVKHEQKIDCGGGYIKIFPSTLDQASFDGDSEYNIMFGPDICGSGHKIVHFILNKKGENHLIQKQISAETDVFTHTYTLNLKKDNTYGIYIDGELKQEGSIVDDFDILPPKKINDPSVEKPSDWDDRKMIPDETDVKPEDYDDIPAMITDEEATQPEEWDEEEDGVWEAPQVPNPEYRGPWVQKRVENPSYQGEWEHPQIDNPEFEEDNELYAFDSNAFIGIEIWQVKAGSIFSNFLVTDDLELALNQAKERVAVTEAEKAQKEAADEKAAEEQRAAAEAAAADNADDGDDEEDKDDL